MAVCHPEAGVRDIQKNIYRLSRAQEHGVLPHQIGLWFAIPGQDQKAPGSVDMEGMVHGMI